MDVIHKNTIMPIRLLLQRQESKPRYIVKVFPANPPLLTVVKYWTETNICSRKDVEEEVSRNLIPVLFIFGMGLCFMLYPLGKVLWIH